MWVVVTGDEQLWARTQRSRNMTSAACAARALVSLPLSAPTQIFPAPAPRLPLLTVFTRSVGGARELNRLMEVTVYKGFYDGAYAVHACDIGVAQCWYGSTRDTVLTSRRRTSAGGSQAYTPNKG